MADNLADFYTGAMAPPDRMPDGSLRPSITTPQMSVSDMYRGIYGAPAARPNITAEGLNVRGVTTKDIVIGPNGFPVASGPKPAPAQVVSNGYDSGYVKTNTDRLPAGTPPALAAIDGVAPRKSNLFAESGYQAKPRFASSVMDRGGGIGADPGDTGMFGIPMSAGMREILANDPKYRTPPGSTPTKWATSRPIARAPAPAPKPTVAQTIASMFLSNGVANPAYRDYTPSYSSEGGGVMPSSSYSGSFTDSLGGTYYDRHL